MTVQMYDADERVTAEEALLTLLKVLPDTMVLLGGWAVYHLVNASYTREHGIPYLGSRDIDVGFHVALAVCPRPWRATTRRSRWPSPMVPHPPT